MTFSFDLPPEIQVESDGPIRIIRLNRPDDLNAANDPLHRGLAAVWRQLNDDHDARVAIITGNGRAFCAGGDFNYLDTLTRDDDGRREMFIDARAIVTGMIDCRIPVIAAVNGPAVGLGCSLVALSDIVFMAETAHLADPHVVVGLVAADGGAISWPLLTSLQLAKEYAFTGDRIPAQRAKEIGMANHVVAPEALMDEALSCAKRIAALPFQAIVDTKRALNIHLERAALAALDFALVTEDRSFLSADTRANLDRYLKRS
jgi:enoyl-CoA hydratase/carnithine racemase